LDAQSNVAGTFAYSPAAGTVLDAGANQTLTATFTPTDTADYASGEQITTTLTVSKATPNLSWTAPAAITYGTALGSGQLDAHSSVAGTYAYSPIAGTVLGAGANQTLTGTFTPTNVTDYVSGGQTTTTITVNQAGLKITPVNTSVAYDAMLPNLSLPSGWAAVGYVNGDGSGALSVQPTCAPTTSVTNTTGRVDVKPGAYGIGCQGATAANYAITYGTGTLTVVKAPTVLVYQGPTTAKKGKSVTVKALLETAGTGGVKISGGKVTIAFKGGKSCSGTTNSSGVMSCKVTAPTKSGTVTVTVTYAGAADFGAATKTASVKVS
jgi:hypothetical protein